MEYKPQTNQISQNVDRNSLPLRVQTQNRGDGNCSLVTPERVFVSIIKMQFLLTIHVIKLKAPEF